MTVEGVSAWFVLAFGRVVKASVALGIRPCRCCEAHALTQHNEHPGSFRCG